MTRSLLCILCLLLAPSLSANAVDPAPLPSDSIYQLDARFTSQAGRDFQLADMRGQPVLVAMFYTSCHYVCPLIIDSAKGIERRLRPAERARLRILLVSMDPARDDVAALRSVASKRRLDPSRWTLARTDEDGVRKFAALLGVRYRKLANGDFNHTSALFLLDGQGRVLTHSDRLGPAPDPAFLAGIQRALTAH
jgi:protein SCO1/2